MTRYQQDICYQFKAKTGKCVSKNDRDRRNNRVSFDD